METTNPLTVNDEAFEPTEAELVILNASDREIKEIQANCKIPEGGIMPRRKPKTDEEILIAVAMIAGWTDIKIWNPSALKKSYTGVNLAHPELGVHIPNYVEDLNAVEKLLDLLDANYQVMRYGKKHDKVKKYFVVFEGLKPDYQDKLSPNYPWFDSLPLGLCKLLLAINPEPIKPEPEVTVIDDDGEIEEPTVIEATFG